MKQKPLPKQCRKGRSFTTDEKSYGDPLPLAVRLKLKMERTQYAGDTKPVLRIKKTEENKQLLKFYITKTLKDSKLFEQVKMNEITERILDWSWRLHDPLEDVENHLNHEIGVAKKPISKKTAQEIVRLMRMGHPDEHGEIYDRFDVMEECARRGKQLLTELGWPTKPDSVYYNLWTGDEDTLLRLSGGDRWQPLGTLSSETTAKLSIATKNEYDHSSVGLSCSTLKFWQKLIVKYPDAKSILKEAVRLDKAYYEYKVHDGTLLSSMKHGDSPCEHNITSIAKWLGIDVTKLEPLNSIPKTDIYAGVWHIVENWQPEPLSHEQKMNILKRHASKGKPAQAALTDFFS